MLFRSFIESLQHFTRLWSLNIDVTVYSEVFEVWESIGALISTGSLNSGINILSIHSVWGLGRDTINRGPLSSGLESVLLKAEVLDPLLDKSFKQLTTLSFEISFCWLSELEDEAYHLRTCFTQPAIEGALRKKLPKISQKVSLNVSVSYPALGVSRSFCHVSHGADSRYGW